MYLMKEKQGGPIPTGLKRWPLKLIKHLADTTCVSPSPSGPTGGCPLNFLYLIKANKKNTNVSRAPPHLVEMHIHFFSLLKKKK